MKVWEFVEVANNDYNIKICYGDEVLFNNDIKYYLSNKENRFYDLFEVEGITLDVSMFKNNGCVFGFVVNIGRYHAMYSEGLNDLDIETVIEENNIPF